MSLKNGISLTVKKAEQFVIQGSLFCVNSIVCGGRRGGGDKREVNDDDEHDVMLSQVCEWDFDLWMIKS